MAQITAVLKTIAISARHLVAVVAGLALLTAGGPSTSLAQDQQDQLQMQQQQQASRQTIPVEQLDQLLAPIALYPDNLLGQILAASTYPLEVVIAARWSAANP